MPRHDGAQDSRGQGCQRFAGRTGGRTTIVHLGQGRGSSGEHQSCLGLRRGEGDQHGACQQYTGNGTTDDSIQLGPTHSQHIWSTGADHSGEIDRHSPFVTDCPPTGRATFAHPRPVALAGYLGAVASRLASSVRRTGTDEGCDPGGAARPAAARARTCVNDVLSAKTGIRLACRSVGSSGQGGGGGRAGRGHLDGHIERVARRVHWAADGVEQVNAVRAAAARGGHSGSGRCRAPTTPPRTSRPVRAEAAD
jgi:hypothetical protein